MTPIEESAELGSNLDCQGHRITGLTALDPVPPPLLSADDPRLSDQRTPLPGTVTDASVAAWAAINQAKLLFNGLPPAAWLGNGAKQMARGDLVQRTSQRNAAGGYVGLDAAGRLPPGSVTTGGGGGKVGSVGLVMPKEFTVSNTPITTNGSFGVAWKNAADASWFGAAGAIGLTPSSDPLLPSFVTRQLPLSLVPNLDGAKFGSGTFLVEQLPVGVGVGASHAVGMVPDPGEAGDPNDYLGRDLKWKPFVVNLAYQPNLKTPEIVLGLSPTESVYTVTISAKKTGTLLFYRKNGGAFIEVHKDGKPSTVTSFSVGPGDFVEAYSAKAGYNNSPIASFVVAIPTPSPES